MAEEQSFDDLKVRYGEQVERVQGMIAEKPEAERPRLERSLNDIQARLAHMQPLGLRSHTLSEAPSEGGVYSGINIDREQLQRLQEPEVRAQIDTALRGTGIRSGVVIARMETGAQNAALERQWIADDLARVAETDDLNLERRADLDIRDSLTAERTEEAPIASDVVIDDEIRRVIAHERDGNLSSPFEADEDRQSYRDAVERELDEGQLDRLKAGDADVLKDQIEDRLDRLYVAKSYLQSDAATANSEAARAVVEEIADREYELHRADTIDSETDRGPTHG